MDDLLKELKLEDLAATTRDKCRNSRLSSKHESPLELPRRSKSVTNHGSSAQKESLRSRSETRVEKNKRHSVSTKNGLDLNDLLNENSRLGKLTAGLQKLKLSDPVDGPSGAQPKGQTFVSSPTPPGALSIDTTPPTHVSETENLSVNHPSGARPKTRVVISSPTPPGAQGLDNTHTPPVSMRESFPVDHSAAQPENQVVFSPPTPQGAQGLDSTPTLHESMRDLLPDFESASGQTENVPQDNFEVSPLNSPPPLFHQPSAVIFENKVWGRDTPLGSEHSNDSMNSDELLSRFGLVNDQIIAMTEELREKNEQLAAAKIAIDSLKDRYNRDMENSESEIDSLSQQVHALNLEREGNKRTNDLLAMKIESISTLTRRLNESEMQYREAVTKLSSLQVELENEKSMRIAETESLREEVDILIKSNRDKEEKTQLLKHKVSRMRYESRALLGSMERSTSSLSLNTNTTDRVMALGGSSLQNGGLDAPTGIPGTDGTINGLPVTNNVTNHVIHNATSNSRGRLRPTLNRMERMKALSFVRWPKFDVFGTEKIDEFIRQIESHISIVHSQGIELDEIAMNLHSELISSSLCDKYSTHATGKDVYSIDGVLDALRACDTISRLLNNHERFVKTLPGLNDDEASYMTRVACNHDTLKIGQPDGSKRIRTIIQQFSDGLNLPKHIANMVRYCQTLDDAVATTMEELNRMKKQNPAQQQHNGYNHMQQQPRQQQQQQQTLHFFNKRFNPQQQQQQQQRPQQQQYSRQGQRGFFSNGRQNAQQMQQQPSMLQQQQPMPQQQQQQQSMLHQQQNMRQQQQQQQPNNTVNVVSGPPTSPPAHLMRAPHGFERDPNNREVMVCTRCRVIGEHRRPMCPYRKFCSLCSCETHTDYEHKNVVQSMSNNARAAPASAPAAAQTHPNPLLGQFSAPPPSQ